jgi:hypothetical protein
MVTYGAAANAKFDFKLPTAVCGKRASFNYVPGLSAVLNDPAAESRMAIIQM